MIQSSRRSRLSARVSRRFTRPAAVVALALLMIVTLVPAAVAADRTAAPERPDGGTVIPARVPDLGVTVLPVPAGAVGIRSSEGYVYGDGTVAVVGEVLNNASTRRRSIVIESTYYDEFDAVLGTYTDVVLLDRVSRGGVGPFLLHDEEPPSPGCGEGGVPVGCIAFFSVRAVSSAATTTPPAGVLQVIGITSTIVGDFREYTATIRNPNSFAVVDGYATLAAYTSDGDVVEATFDQPNGTGNLAAGASATVVFGVHVNIDHSRVMIQADAFRAGQTGSYVTSWSNYFDDLFGIQFRTDIVWLAEEGFTAGCGPGRYCPTSAVTRGQMASFLSRALDLPATATDYFTDDEGNTHEANINRLAEAGITGGCAPSRYCPNANVQRDQMASFLSRALDLPATTTDYFTDDEGNTHEANINRLREAGITGGCGGGTKYCPTANVTRAQMAAFLRRAFE